MKHEPMSQERLAEARAALDEDMSQWGGEYGLELIAEVERLRALTTVGDDMVERAAFTLARRFEKHPYLRVGALGHDFTPDARAALDAALTTGEQS